MSEEKKYRDDLLTRIAELQETIRIATRNRTPLNYAEGQDARNLLSDIAALFPNPDETGNGQASLNGCLNILDEIEVGSFNSDDIQTIRNVILYLQRENIMLKENLAKMATERDYYQKKYELYRDAVQLILKALEKL